MKKSLIDAETWAKVVAADKWASDIIKDWAIISDMESGRMYCQNCLRWEGWSLDGIHHAEGCVFSDQIPAPVKSGSPI